MTEPRPFDDTQWTLDGLTVDSAADRVALSGSLDLTADAAGLAKARQLATYLAAVVTALKQRQQAGELPDHLASAPITTGPSPFA